MNSDNPALVINKELQIPLSEIEVQGIRAQGAGGQNVNKVSSAIHLRFDIKASSLPDHYKARLRAVSDKRISSEGVIVIKAQRFRSQEKNRADALDRLKELIEPVTIRRKPRRPTKPSAAARRRRLDNKTRRGQLKSLRGRVDD